jgi:HAMP domain-containing protein
MRAFLFVLSGFLCGALSLATPSRAENQTRPAGEQGRYAMTPAEGGFLRLDTQTGSVSFCSVKDGQSVCRAGADEIAALEAEVSRLRQENAELKSKLSGAPAAPPKDSSGVPSEEEFDRTLSFAERFLRRMMKVLREEAPDNKL